MTQTAFCIICMQNRTWDDEKFKIFFGPILPQNDAPNISEHEKSAKNPLRGPNLVENVILVQ